MLNNDVARILDAKTHSQSNCSAPVMFGALSLKLKLPCSDLEQLLVSGCTPLVRFFLVSLYDPVTCEVMKDYIKIENGENVIHLEVFMDYRLESSEARKAFKALFRTSAKAFLVYESPKSGESPVIILELWALEKLCEFNDPSAVVKKTVLSTHSNNLVEALYPEMVAEQQESLMPEGMYMYM